MSLKVTENGTIR